MGCGVGIEYVFKNADEWHEQVLATITNDLGSQTLCQAQSVKVFFTIFPIHFVSDMQTLAS